MKTIRPVPIGEFDFTPYGSYYNLLENSLSIAADMPEMYRSASPVTSRSLRLGITVCGGGSFITKRMERHISTEELLFPGDKPLILAIAGSDPESAPQQDDLRAVIIRHGDLIVLKPGIWHDACRAVSGETLYYFMAKNDGSARETEWVTLQPGPVQVSMG